MVAWILGGDRDHRCHQNRHSYCRPRRMWMRRMWGPVLGQSFFGWLILMIPSQQSLGLSLVGEVVSSVPRNWDIEHGHGSMSWTITLWVTLIHFSEEWREIGGYWSFFLTDVSQLSSFLLRYSIKALIEDLSPPSRTWMRSGFSEALSASNPMDWECLRWDTQLWTSFHWEFRLTILQIVSTKALKSPRLFWRKV